MIVYKRMFYVLNYGFLVLSLNNNVAMETCASILKWHRIMFSEKIIQCTEYILLMYCRDICVKILKCLEDILAERCSFFVLLLSLPW